MELLIPLLSRMLAVLASPLSYSGKECGEDCDNNRIYVSGLPTTITENDLVEKFSGIGIIARIRQVRTNSSSAS